ncbi:hypothetical protein CEXT_511771 [Caerostris extrusa]|uniref:Uncharacterized protein n=1 Tax=Caerostris extrusa TaxID=172846 RepID=A0AAV4ME48_CAEEX|nr:hypothetical protein CEXT_511771 [Caerostris extrusa]
MLLELHPNRPLPTSFQAFGGYRPPTEREFAITLAASHVRMKEESVLTGNRHSPMLVSRLFELFARGGSLLSQHLNSPGFM